MPLRAAEVLSGYARHSGQESHLKAHRFANIALVVISLGLAYLLLELVLFPAVLPHLPLNQHAYIGRMSILAQTSKSGTVPIDYIALAGDSYAQGKGDWFKAVARKGHGPFHSAHVLHQLSGRDVVTFGRGGAGSLEGMAGEPMAQYRYIDGSPWLALEPPRVIIAYVYEGNDFNNNLRALVTAKLVSPNTTGGVDVAKLERYVTEWSEQLSSDAGTAVAPVLTYAVDAVVGTYDTIAENEAKKREKKEKKEERRKNRG